MPTRGKGKKGNLESRNHHAHQVGPLNAKAKDEPSFMGLAAFGAATLFVLVACSNAGPQADATDWKPVEQALGPLMSTKSVCRAVI